MKTRKYIPNKTLQFALPQIKKSTRKNMNLKYLNKLFSSIDNIENIIVLRPNRCNKDTKIINYIHGLEDVLQINVLKNKFKTLFTLDYMDYMNYINLDIHKRRSAISRISLKYDKQPIIFEGYLAILISSGFLFDAYMLDTLKIITPTHTSRYGKQQEALHFPHNLPDNFLNESSTPSKILSKIYEVIKQAYTIIKYVAIILAHQKLSAGGSDSGSVNINAFEIIKNSNAWI